MSITSRSQAERALFVDNYQLTMAQLYFRMGIHERPTQFEHFTRANPNYGTHQAGYCISAGLEWLLDWMDEARFTADDIAALRSQQSSAGTPLFDDDFLAWLLANGNYEALTIRAVPEGRVVHPNAPLTMVRGPLAMAQILETSLLNHLNFQTLIATKASRVVEAARSQPVLEFGLRRSPERGASAATRAAFIGGADFSSNTGVSHILGVPPKGTHAHSLIQVFMALGLGEIGAFRAYAEQYPDDCVLLVDTIDTLNSGVPNAIRIFDELKAKGHRPSGIRLDSGDLAYLSIQSAVQLNDAGYDDVAIVLSSGLDELLILQILAQIDQEAPRYGIDPKRLVGRLSFGVGSKLTASKGQPYLDGVYKMVAIEDNGAMVPAIKISESTAKQQNPGDKDVVRVYDDRGRATADVLSIAGERLDLDHLRLHHHTQHSVERTLTRNQISGIEPLLATVYEQGSRPLGSPSLEEMRANRTADLDLLDPGVRRLVNPHTYHVSLTTDLWELKQRLISEARSGSQPPVP
ncbi:MAG: nicotinate phosphoribosyltransferase [Acidimicrobiales bacterium]